MGWNVAAEVARIKTLAKKLGLEILDDQESNLSNSRYVTLGRNEGDEDDDGGGMDTLSIRVSGHEQRPAYYRPHDLEIGPHQGAHRSIADPKPLRCLAEFAGRENELADIRAGLEARRTAALSAAKTRRLNVRKAEESLAAQVADVVRNGGRYSERDLRSMVFSTAEGKGQHSAPAVARIVDDVVKQLKNGPGSAKFTTALHNRVHNVAPAPRSPKPKGSPEAGRRAAQLNLDAPTASGAVADNMALLRQAFLQDGHAGTTPLIARIAERYGISKKQVRKAVGPLAASGSPVKEAAAAAGAASPKSI